MQTNAEIKTLSGAPGPDTRPLVIGLDSLLRSSLGQEAYVSGWAALLRSPRDALVALSGGRSIGEWLKSRSQIDYGKLPYEADVLNRALAARAHARKVYLATAKDTAHASAISAHFGFDGVVVLDAHGAPAEANDPHARLLRQTGFEYAGNPSAAGGQAGQERRVSLRTWLGALRVYQYAKNTLVFVPLITSHQFNLASLENAVLAFFAFSAAASSAYLLNDILDLNADRHHPTKRNRAIASGRLPIASALTAVPFLAVTALITAAAISWLLLATVVSYLVITVAYSLQLKKMLLVDIIALAGLYTTRILGGAIAINVHLSEWLLIFSLFVFTSLALTKRYGELSMRQGAGLADPVNRDYRVSDLSIVAVLAGACGMNAITIFSLYISSPAVTSMYRSPGLLWLLNPLLLYWIGRALMVAHRQEMQDDPIVYTFKDWPSRITIALMTCIALAAI
jgi:4-hydroxybenzoate polyprenyltransferase